MSSARKKGSRGTGGGSARPKTSSGSARSPSRGSSRSGSGSGNGSSGGGGGSSSRSAKPSSSAGSSSRTGSRNASNASRSSSSQLPEQLGLRQTVQKRFLTDVFEASSAVDSGWKILIVDEPSMRVISSAVGMYDIMERKISLVESIDKARAPFRDMSAIYIIEPNKDSVAKLLNDFVSKDKVLYGKNIFVYFLGTIPDQVVSQIKSCKHLIRRLKALTEVNVNFLSREERAFQLYMPKTFSAFYLRNGPAPIELAVAERLVTVCATMNEYPYIRYKQSSGICNSLASLFHMKMDEFVASNPSWWYHGSGKSENKHAERDRSTLLLLDRADDCLTPLMHDFSYQAMVRDLLSMEGDKITYQAESADDPNKKEAKDVLLNEKDELWVELRGKHIAEVIEILSSRIQEMVNSSTGSSLAKKSGGDTMSLGDMAAALKALPEYREVMSKLSQHMNISHECMGKFNQGGLLDLAEIEQTLATGKDDEGRAPKMSEMISRVESALVRMVDPAERLRFVLLATISQNGLSHNDRDRILRVAQLDRNGMLTLNNLEQLGISTINDAAPSTASKFFGRGKLVSSGSFDEDSEYTSMRYVPGIKSICNDLAANQLSLEDFPSVVPMPENATNTGSAISARRRGKAEGSARKKTATTSKWSRATPTQTSTKKSTNFTGPRNLIFMVGGISYSELRVCREVMEKESREFIIGSTEFLSPSKFVEDLSSLSPQ
mmetsp:Transcript_2540/g.6878  ORF Transcript_2540/g.6878 Transcript_2540/m.6878 type:complete len:721 (-) Transcript_2540:90-2252(-)|eukprot:CAMPEP_0119558300 /NCGR_PEP_ID=MMETSP1352-20130426/10557_1 /TAXON_ID=265584 /ORGANISM="Stauroneis constricta, Strain CCMP1120" /LENGTH=720 /DNA_ID=CAMNT_0007605621 /DNA_START=195 /DNA_END=2357 /DNA_ORIENTATION=-